MKALHKKISTYLAIALALLPCAGLSACGEKQDTTNEPAPKLQAITPAEGKLVVLCNEEIAAFTENYAPYSSGSFAVEGADRFAMKPLTLKWEEITETDTYEVAISTKADMSDSVKYTADTNSISVSDLFVSTQYYWQVTRTTAGVEPYQSEIHSFKTVTTPRTIRIQDVSNTRDFGGYPTESGKYVRQGMAYRGATLDSIGEQGIKDALETYSIKTELDVRNATESHGRTVSSFGEETKYYSYSCPYYVGDHGLDLDKTRNPEEIYNLASAIKVFASAENYPIYFHCSLGRDRTGMIAMLLQGLLGVSEEHIYMDYETSFFSERGCADFAGRNPQLVVGHMVDSLNSVYQYINRFDETRDALPFSKNCEAYLLHIGVTAEEIASIRSLLLTE